MHHIGRLLAVCAVAATAACAASPRVAVIPPQPEYAAMQPRTAALWAGPVADSVASVLERAARDSAFPAAIAIVGDRAGAHVQVAVGRLDWNRGPAPDEHTIWDLASLTKVIGTTTAVGRLVERGSIHLDAPVRQYLPGWSGLYTDQVTVRHLLTHTSGLPAFRAYDEQTTNADSLHVLMFGTPVEAAPGARMIYSDIGAYLLGRLLEAVAGEPLDSVIAREVLRPTGMQNTGFRPDASQRERIAPTEVDPRRGGLVHGVVHDERAYYLGGVAAHAGMFGTAHDLARFGQMMLNGGALPSGRLLHAETIDTFTAYADPERSNRALGWQKPVHERMVWATPASTWAGTSLSPSAYGHTGFTGTSIAIDPELDLFIVLLSNRVNPTRANPRIGRVRAELTDAVVAALRR